MKHFIKLFLMALAFGVGSQFFMAERAEASPTCVLREVAGDEHNGFWCFAIGADNAMWTISYDVDTGGFGPRWRSLGGTFQGALSCRGAAAPDRDPAPAPVDPNPDDDVRPLTVGAPSDYYTCFARGLDGAIHHRSTVTPRQLSLGGTFAGSPRCTLNQCFARGADNSLYRGVREFRDRESSVVWTSLGGTILGDPECIALVGGRVDCFVRNSVNGLSHIACPTRTRCAEWSTLDGTFSGTPSCVAGIVRTGARAELARIDCFVRGTDNTVFQKTNRGSGVWTGWTRISTQAVGGDPECVALSDFRTVCVALEPNGRLTRIVREGDTWSEWRRAANMQLTGRPSCIFSPVYNVVHCVARGTSGRMVHTQINFEGVNNQQEVRELVLHE